MYVIRRDFHHAAVPGEAGILILDVQPVVETESRLRSRDEEGSPEVRVLRVAVGGRVFKSAMAGRVAAECALRTQVPVSDPVCPHVHQVTLT